MRRFPTPTLTLLTLSLTLAGCGVLFGQGPTVSGRFQGDWQSGFNPRLLKVAVVGLTASGFAEVPVSQLADPDLTKAYLLSLPKGAEPGDYTLIAYEDRNGDGRYQVFGDSFLGRLCDRGLVYADREGTYSSWFYSTLSVKAGWNGVRKNENGQWVAYQALGYEGFDTVLAVKPPPGPVGWRSTP